MFWTTCTPRLRGAQYAIYATAYLNGGLLPDLLGEAGAWQPRLWTYAVSAVVLHARAAADRLGQTMPDITERIADHLGLQLSVDPRSTR